LPSCCPIAERVMTSPRLLTSVIGMITVPSGQAQAKNPIPQRQISVTSTLRCGANIQSCTRVRFSPDGSQVAFVLFGVDNVRENQLWHLIVVSRAGQNAREVTEESGSLLHFIDVPGASFPALKPRRRVSCAARVTNPHCALEGWAHLYVHRSDRLGRLCGVSEPGTAATRQ
jgi:hypothetical protein